jgi:CRP/FNR family transcriptional regulator, cyclic AMP receptor protein
MPVTKSPVIEALCEADRHRLLDRAVPRSLNKGQRLYLSGDGNQRAHLVVSGLLKLVGRSGGGNETILGLAVPGELVGEIAALDGHRQPLDAVAASRCELLGLDADVLVHGLSHDPGAAMALARLMARRSRWVCDTALERATTTVPARLAGRLLDLAALLGRADPRGVEVDLPLGQRDLGMLAGICRESACKTLGRFRAAGVLDYRGNRLLILELDALERIRCSGTLGPARALSRATIAANS